MLLSKSQQQILDAVKAIYIEKGYAGTSMNAIAEKVGIRKASLYAHFKSKEALFRVLFSTIMQNHKCVLDGIFRSLEGDSAQRDLYHLMSRYVKYCYDTPDIDIWTRGYYFPPEPLKAWLQGSTHHTEMILRDKMIEIIARGQTTHEIRQAPSEQLMNPFYHLMLGYLMSYSEYEFDDIRDDLFLGFKLLWTGISIKKVKES